MGININTHTWCQRYIELHIYSTKLVFICQRQVSVCSFWNEYSFGSNQVQNWEIKYGVEDETHILLAHFLFRYAMVEVVPVFISLLAELSIGHDHRYWHRHMHVQLSIPENSFYELLDNIFLPNAHQTHTWNNFFFVCAVVLFYEGLYNVTTLTRSSRHFPIS